MYAGLRDVSPNRAASFASVVVFPTPGGPTSATTPRVAPFRPSTESTSKRSSSASAAQRLRHAFDLALHLRHILRKGVVRRRLYLDLRLRSDAENHFIRAQVP